MSQLNWLDVSWSVPPVDVDEDGVDDGVDDFVEARELAGADAAITAGALAATYEAVCCSAGPEADEL